MKKFVLRVATLLSVAAVIAVCATRVGWAAEEEMTPVLMAVEDAPIPFHGSDGQTHLVYELWMTNFSSGEVKVEKVDVLGDGKVIASLDGAEVASRLQPAGSRESSAMLAAGAQALLFLHVTLAPGAAVPAQLSHRVGLHANAAPPGYQEMTETGGAVKVNRQEVVVVGPPLRGAGYLSADSCCDATRHTRAAMPVNGRVYVAQRYAVDWEQIDSNKKVYSGPQKSLESYTIFGKDVLAVADGKIVFTRDGVQEGTPGQYPTNIALKDADGNSIILDLGKGRYALYAHLKTGSVRVKEGDTVKAGQVIGLVGNTGNSIVPHLHFHVVDRGLSMASNGVPYEIREFTVTGETAGGTKAFDEAEEKGTPLPTKEVTPAKRVEKAMPLDQLVITLGEK